MTTTPRHSLRAGAFLLVLLTLTLHSPASAATFISQRSGDWSSAQTWGSTSAPCAGDIVIIRWTTTVTIPSGYAAACASLTIGSTRGPGLTSVLQFADATSSLTVSGNLIIGAVLGPATTTGTINMSSGGTLSVGSLSVVALGNWAPGTGTVVLTSGSTLPSQLTTFHHLTIDAQTTASSNISVTGDWTNNASFIPGTHTVTFLGSAQQTLGGSASSGFYNLTLNKSGGMVRLHRSVSLAGNLVFASYTSGGITLGNQDLTLSTSSAISGHTSQAFVVTDSNGVLTHGSVGATPVVFPVGPDALSYNPVTITNGGTADAFSVRVRAGFDNAPYSSAYVDRQWTILEGSPGGSDVTLALKWTASSDEASGFSRTSALQIGRWENGAWSAVSASHTDHSDGTHTATSTGITSLSSFGVGNAGALPVELTSFSARRKNADAILTWTTATESNNFGFDVERSADRERWHRIGFVPGHGNSASPKDYSFVDERAASAAPVLYYRLRQIDRDGTTDYSSVTEVRTGVTGFELAQNYPNPFTGTTTLGYTLPQGQHVTLRLHDLLGNEVATLAAQTQSAGSYSLTLDPVSLGLRPGQYLCVLRAGNRVATRTLVYMP